MIDRLIVEFDFALRTLFVPAPSRRDMPAGDANDEQLSEAEKRHSAALMRVNHSGEICAQALYRGQALTSGGMQTRDALMQAAWEETEHLNWTERRVERLGGRTSLLDPFWYAGSLVLGILAGKAGDAWNLGFLAETERQVEGHLDGHLERLPAKDSCSRAIIEQMKRDEVGHAATARALGGRDLPEPIRIAMRLASRAMTGTAYRV